MAEKLTPQQAQAVNHRGGRLLVSAAAGSGKTKVLVDRLMGFLTDGSDPANIDDFLIITYTKAAASELRAKIAAKLTERIAQEPENRHLQQQMQRLYLAKISTVHAFCADLLREYAYRLDLPADFRVADESESRELQQQVMETLLDGAYDAIGDDPDFQAFVDTQGLGRNDSSVSEILLSVYQSARCHLDPALWLDQCLDNMDLSEVADAAQTPWGRYLVEDLFAYLDRQIGAMTQCAQAAEAVAGWEKPTALLWDTVRQLEFLRASQTWDEIDARREIDFGKLTFRAKDADPDLENRIKAVRNACKDGLKKKLSGFADSSRQVLADLAQSAPAARSIISMVKRFSQEYDRAKRGRRMMDFGDLEHRTLDLLVGKRRGSPTAAAGEIGKRFREIMVDEYQDSNAVQDAIFSALTHEKGNLFMVGDVKQSIYQFRQADPGIFLKKYAAFAPEGEEDHGQGHKVLLSSNFRSGGGVISAVNDVFRACMSAEVGGLDYGEAEALREGAAHIALGEPEVELHLVEKAQDGDDEEADYVAQRIAELLDGKHMVRQGDALRPIVPEDIVILLRAPASARAPVPIGVRFRDALQRRGIRSTTGGGTDLLKTEEIQSLRSLLETISNPRQDIPLIAALAGPVFGFTADDLAAIRGKNRRMCVYDALLLDDSEKSKNFVRILTQLRQEARMHTLAQLLERIFSLTGMDSVYAAMPGGEERSANLQAFCLLAANFETNGRRDLSQFLDYLNAMEVQGIRTEGEQGGRGVVTIMSIHKSKGLEFPVVFLCGLSRHFNRDSASGQVLCDRELGLGLSCVDMEKRIRYPSVSKRAIAVKKAAQSVSEEMRVLYVAMTRARDRLIMTCAASSATLSKSLTDLVSRKGVGERELLTLSASSPGKWILLAALERTEAGELFQLGGYPAQTKPGNPPWRIRVAPAPEPGKAAAEEAGSREPLPPETFRKLRESLAFSYAHTAATQAPSKQTATQRKGRIKDQEAAEHAREPRPVARAWRKPGFVERSPQGTAYGSAMHAALQYIRYEACTGEAETAREITRLVDQRYITPEQGAMVNCGKLARFFSTDLGKKLRASGDRVIREFKFSILEDGSAYGPGLEGEQVLLQGVVDCALLEEDGITVVDFKTDFVLEPDLPKLVDRYRPQVEAYAEALQRIFQKPVREKLLYLFYLDRFAPL